MAQAKREEAVILTLTVEEAEALERLLRTENWDDSDESRLNHVCVELQQGAGIAG